MENPAHLQPQSQAMATAMPTQGQEKKIWILSKYPDILFFIASGFLGLAFGLFAPYTGFAKAGSAFIYIFLGLTHFGSTWFFYLDGEHRGYFKTKPWIFYYVPIILIVLPIALAFANLSEWLIIITYWFSGFHVMKQSAGITSIYRHRLGVKTPDDKSIDNFVIISASFLALTGRYVLRSDFEYDQIFRTQIGKMVVVGILALFVYSLVKWIAATIKRFKQNGALALPLFFFSLVSILLFSPFLYVEDFTVAFMANLTGHYVQYVVLVWMITRKKYWQNGEVKKRAPVMHFLSHHGYWYGAALIAYALLVTYVDTFSILLPVIGLTWAHFYLDRYFFRFKDPNMRKMILPYL